jgi:hypothetical protein
MFSFFILRNYLISCVVATKTEEKNYDLLCRILLWNFLISCVVKVQYNREKDFCG